MRGLWGKFDCNYPIPTIPKKRLGVLETKTERQKKVWVSRRSQDTLMGRALHCLPSIDRNNSGMLRQLQRRADDLAECLLISELEMRRSRTLQKKMEAFRAFGSVVDRIDALRRDAELLHFDEKGEMISRLDRKVGSVMRSPAYRIAEWFSTDSAELAWFVGPESIDPMRQLRPC
jgi:hypothetical protein